MGERTKRDIKDNDLMKFKNVLMDINLSHKGDNSAFISHIASISIHLLTYHIFAAD